MLSIENICGFDCDSHKSKACRCHCNSRVIKHTFYINFEMYILEPSLLSLSLVLLEMPLPQQHFLLDVCYKMTIWNSVADWPLCKNGLLLVPQCRDRNKCLKTLFWLALRKTFSRKSAALLWCFIVVLGSHWVSHKTRRGSLLHWFIIFLTSKKLYKYELVIRIINGWFMMQLGSDIEFTSTYRGSISLVVSK